MPGWPAPSCRLPGPGRAGRPRSRLGASGHLSMRRFVDVRVGWAVRRRGYRLRLRLHVSSERKLAEDPQGRPPGWSIGSPDVRHEEADEDDLDRLVDVGQREPRSHEQPADDRRAREAEQRQPRQPARASGEVEPDDERDGQGQVAGGVHREQEAAQGQVDPRTGEPAAGDDGPESDFPPIVAFARSETPDSLRSHSWSSFRVVTCYSRLARFPPEVRTETSYCQEASYQCGGGWCPSRPVLRS